MRYLTPVVAALCLSLSGCGTQPETYAPPVQRKPLTGPGQESLGQFVAMNDVNADAYIVRDVNRSAEGMGWRWANQRPELRFLLSTTERLKFVMDFSVPEVTFKQTGPVTLTILVNGNPLDKVRCDAPGERRYEKPVPPEWLRTDATTSVVIEVDKPYVAPADQVKLGFILTRAGFIQ